MSQAEEMFEAGINNSLNFYNREGKSFLRVPLWLGVILVIAAPQLLVLVLVLMALNLVAVKLENCC